jgi:glycosyltransferase involved in cell wall biosynthesis
MSNEETDSLLINDASLLEEALAEKSKTPTVDDDDFLLFTKPQKKYKIVVLSDHPLAPSGVGVQARFLIEGLVATGKFSFRCLGGAIKHDNYETIGVNQDFIVKPVDGFGNPDMIKSILLAERPDALLLFTDPRQFIWVWEMADEIKQICPITYWHVWDNDPYPKFNFPWYESTDLINCLAHKTYELVKPNFPDKTNYIPHAFPKSVYFPIPEPQRTTLRKQHLGAKADWFTVLWVNRNATRKMPADTMDAFKMFLDKLEAKHGHRNASLIMHTNPTDQEGPNLLAVSELLGLQGNVMFSPSPLQFDQMNVMHNITDTCLNIAKNEGFGLSTLITMQVGKPIIALATGGTTRQVIDHRDGFEYGVAIKPSKRSLVGSQMVPYIYEDFCTSEQVSDALMKLHEMTPEEKKIMEKKCFEYVDLEFSFDKMISEWARTLEKCITDFKEKGKGKKWTLNKIPNALPAQTEKPASSVEIKLEDRAIRDGLKMKKVERRKVG